MTDRRSEPDTAFDWLAALPEAVCVTDAQLDGPGPRIRYVNAAFERLVGCASDEVAGRRLGGFLGGKADAAVSPEMRAVLRAGRTWRVRAAIGHKAGGTLDVAWAISPVRDRAGTVTGYVGTVTEMPRADAAELRGDASLESFENAPFGIYNITPDGRFTWVNPAMARIYGCADAAEFLATFANTDAAFADPGNPYLPAYQHKASRDAFRGEMARFGRVTGFEALARRRDDTPFWSQEDARAVYADDGTLLGYEGFIQDISARKEAERQLRENAALLEMAGRVARFGGWAADLGAGVVHWSDVVADIHEMPRGASPPIDVTMAFIAESDRARIRAAFDLCATEGTPYDLEAELVTATGRRTWGRLAGEAVRDEGGEIVCVQGALQDISERKRVETELRRARDQARAADASKTQFLANISHELRTPLNAILGFSDLIRNATQPVSEVERHSEYADHIFESGSHLLELVNDLLDMARIDQGAYTLREEPVGLTEVVEASLKLVRHMARQKAIELTTDLPAGLPGIYADARALRQVVLNLLTNAIKFTPEGGRVSVIARNEADELRLDVADTGVGIPPGDIERVLRPFERVEKHLSHDRRGGTGLGLGISRSLVEMHDGELTLRSTPDVGTVARIHLPKARLVP